MAGSASSALCASVRLPAVEQTTRTQWGPWQIVVEHVRGGLAVLVHDGRVEQRAFIGAPDDGKLLVCARAPAQPVRLHVAERLTLPPHGRLRGYVAVPLPHELLWVQGTEQQGLADLLPRGLQTSWLGSRIGYVHEVWSGFSLDLEGCGREADAIVPVVLRNVGQHVMSPAEIVLRFGADELRGLRGRIFAAPRTLEFRGEEQVVEEKHPFLGGGT